LRILFEKTIIKFMKETGGPKNIRRHPDTGEELSEEEQDEISSYNSDVRNFVSRNGISRFPRIRDLIAEPFDRLVTPGKDLDSLRKRSS